MNEILAELIAFVPRVLGAIAIAIFGFVLAAIARRSILLLLERLGFNQLSARLGVTTLLQEGGLQRGPAQIIGTIIFYVVLILALLAAVGALGLDFLALTLNEVFLYAPRALAAVLLLIMGTAAASLLSRLTESALTGAGITRTNGLVSFVRYGVMFVAVLLAATTLQIDVTILIVIMVIALGGLALAAALALGLGLRGLSQNIAASRYMAERIAEGDRISVNGFEGTVEQIGYAVTTLRHVDGREYLIPNSYFREHVVERTAADLDGSPSRRPVL